VALPRSDLLHSGPAITGVFVDLSNFAVKLQSDEDNHFKEFLQFPLIKSPINMIDFYVLL